jgi:protein TonB
MLDRLVASHPEHTRRGTTGSAVVAVLLHGGLLTAGVVATLPAPRAAQAPAPPIVRVIYYPPAPASRPVGSRPSGPVALPNWSALNVVPPDLPAPDLEALPVSPGRGDPSASRDPGIGGPGGYGPLGFGPGEPGTPPGAVYRALTVDAAPVMLTHPVLEYPALLRSAGVEGIVVFEVVIDSTGAPEPGSLRVVQASHPAFVAAATRAVLAARFRPGRAQGRPVRVLIRQPIVFRLTR